MDSLETMFMETTTVLNSNSNFFNAETMATESDVISTFFPLNFTGSSTTLSPLPQPNVIIYCGPGWKSFWDSLSYLINPLRLILCVVGIVTNCLNICVFTRRPMRNPTNTILTALCFADLLILIRFAEHFTVHRLTPLGGPEWVNTFPMGVHALASDILVQLFHAWSVYLTLALSLWRLLGVAYPLKSRRWCSNKGAQYAIATALCIGVVLMGIMYCHASVGIREYKEENGMKIPQYGMVMDPVYDWHLYLLIHIIFIKFAPCCILTIVTTTLVVYLLKAKKNRTKLFKSGGTVRQPGSTLSSSEQHEVNQELPQSVKQKLEYDRTTKMLLVVLIVFLVTEFPFAIINILNNILKYDFGVQCKDPMLRFLSTGEYISSSTSFFVYFIMSKNFRAQFFKILKFKTDSNPSSSSQVTRTGGDSSGKSFSTTTIVSHV